MKTYVKIYGPPLLKAIKALEKLAIDMPEVCIKDSIMGWEDLSILDDPQAVSNYFSGIGEIKVERCNNIISKSGETLGEYDFFFEWFTEPTMDQLNDLIEKIDEALAPIGAKYSTTTKK